MISARALNVISEHFRLTFCTRENLVNVSNSMFCKYSVEFDLVYFLNELWVPVIMFSCGFGYKVYLNNIGTSTRQNLSSGFSTKRDSSQSPHL